jgi:hypothetical protein
LTVWQAAALAATAIIGATLLMLLPWWLIGFLG